MEKVDCTYVTKVNGSHVALYERGISFMCVCPFVSKRLGL